ncbi:MHS family MFS transporter [Pseudarthrobacter sp. RMG13]|uniref:MHS family MFS transporter n=1 Tax=Pseudarthrobacter humi TaxID=2952523 RepID=A0ABT1LIH4_9MICC|nr:MFS transporter [Pseudarthrobacter humi]MCP8998253.1 MHS family MFS transporter [Pseudarthrobacter humi]
MAENDVVRSKSAVLDPEGNEVAPGATDKAPVRRAAWAGLIGTALEQYDFVIYGTASAIIFNKIFFPNIDPAIGIIAAFGAYAVGFGARPLGGLFFSKYGDRLGRKWVLVATLFLMGIATFAIGLLPTYEQAGIWAPVLLVACRFLQGFGAGAEQAGGVVLVAETAPKGSRGRYASLVFVGAAAGTAMGAVVWILVQMMPREALEAYGWRLVFFSSIFVTIAAYVIRRKLKESPVFEEKKEEIAGAIRATPVADVVKNGRAGLFRVFFMNVGANAHSYIFQVFLGSYLITQLKIDATFIPKVLLVGALFACVSAYAFGTLSDRFGRRRMYLIITAFLFVFPVPAFLLLNTGNLFLISLVIVLGFIFAAQGSVGVQAAYFPELFGSRYRYAGVALGREFSSVFGGGIAPLICSALVTAFSGSWIPVAIYMMAMMGISLVTTIKAPETVDRDLLTEEDAK